MLNDIKCPRTLLEQLGKLTGRFSDIGAHKHASFLLRDIETGEIDAMTEPELIERLAATWGWEDDEGNAEVEAVAKVVAEVRAAHRDLVTFTAWTMYGDTDAPVDASNADDGDDPIGGIFFDIDRERGQ